MNNEQERIDEAREKGFAEGYIGGIESGRRAGIQAAIRILQDEYTRLLYADKQKPESKPC